MAVIAANSVTSTSPANAASSSANASASGDVFAAMLDQLAQDLTNGMAVASADAVSGSDADAQDDAAATPTMASDPSTCATAPMSDPILAQLLAAQQAAATGTSTPASTGTTSADTDTTDSDAAQTSSKVPTSDTASAPPAQVESGRADTSAINRSTTTTPDPNARAADQSVARDDGQPADRVHGKGHHARADAALASDPSLDDPSQAGDTSAPDMTLATNTPQANTSAVPATPIDPATAAAAALSASNQAAASVVANGATAKPAKATPGVASADSSKSEGRNSKASALADAGDVTKRGFASEPVVRAAALPIQSKADDADNAPSNGGAPTQPPQQDAANPVTAATSAQPEAAPIQQPAAPVHAAATPAPQADPNVSIATVNAGASPTQTPATPAHIAAQIQVSQHAPDVDALAVNIAARSQDGQKHFDIRLDPVELGRVDVRLTIDDAGKAQAMLSVEKPQTLELLQKDSSHLERALKDAGLDLTQNGLSFSLKGQQQQQQGAQDHAPFARGQRLAARAVAEIHDITPTLPTSGIAASDTRLDIRV